MRWPSACLNTIRPSPLSRHALLATVFILLGTALFLVLRYAALPDVLPVHFKPDGSPDGWQFRTVGRALLPVFVQLALAVGFSAIAALLLSRGAEGHSSDAPDVRAASAAAETVLLIALIWVAFQAYAAFALVRMWTTAQGGGLGRDYVALEMAGLALTAVVAARGYRGVGRPVARPFVPEHWRFGQLYKNAADPALFVPTRDGSRWTLNFGRPKAATLLGVVLCAGVLGPTLIILLAFRYDF